jgi:hypothetical protein
MRLTAAFFGRARTPGSAISSNMGTMYITTFDESLERLKERQEALDRLVEETLALHKHNERRVVSPETAWPMGPVLEKITRLSQKAQAHHHKPKSPDLPR